MFMPAPCSLTLPGMVEEAKEKREDTYIPYSAELVLSVVTTSTNFLSFFGGVGVYMSLKLPVS